MSDVEINPEQVRSYTVARCSLLVFAKTVNDEDSLIVRNVNLKRTVIVPIGRYGEFHAFPEQVALSAIDYAQALFPGHSLTKHEVHNLADIVLNNYDLVFNHRPEKERSIEELMERDGLIVKLDGETIIDASR